jgi:hypothetical protein
LVPTDRGQIPARQDRTLRAESPHEEINLSKAIIRCVRAIDATHTQRRNAFSLTKYSFHPVKNIHFDFFLVKLFEI